jgi:hypothetical protein
MFSTVSRLSILLLAVLAMSFALPAGFDKLFHRHIDDPLLFYSPVLQQFIYQKSLGDHRHAYRDEDGRSYDRQEFEELLPFLYFRNLERRNLLPVVVNGRTFNAQDIADDRQGLEIRARHLRGHYPQMQLYPLFNNDPETAMIRFPVEVFRFTDAAMEFVNADLNRIDRELTDRFTRALEERGFTFPATVIGGKPTNLKPFDDGYFIRDAAGRIFHIKRVLDQPKVVATGIDPTLDVLDIVVVENERREFHGLIITRQGGVFLISWGDYRLIPLPVAGYDPARMDFKLLIDPLHRTAIVSSKRAISGVAMAADYQPLRRFELVRTDYSSALIRQVREFLFPFQLRLDSPDLGQADLHLSFGGPWSGIGILAALGVLLVHARRRTPHGFVDFALVTLTGIFGLIAVLMLRTE